VQMILLSMHQAIALFTSRTGSQSVEVAA
jgi:hypothetical protein